MLEVSPRHPTPLTRSKRMAVPAQQEITCRNFSSKTFADVLSVNEMYLDMVFR